MLTLVTCAGAPARAAEPSDPLAELLRQSEEQPETARRALSQLLAREDLDLALRRRAERAWPRVLERCGQRTKAVAAWRALLRRGVDVASELLRLEGARLEVELAPLQPDAKPRVALRGERSGPVDLRLYRVDVDRLRLALEDQADLFAQLRAPPPATLHKLAAWRSAAPGEEPLVSEAPRALPAGLYLLVVQARGVARPIPLRVPGAAVLSEATPGGALLWTVDRAGEPLGGLEWTGYDALGRKGALLGRTGAGERDAGLLRVEAGVPWALAWRGPELLLVRLPEPTPPPAAEDAGPLGVLPRARAGQRLWVAARPEGRGPLRLETPAGLLWASGGRASSLALELPAWAPAGEWTLRQGEGARPLRVEAPETPGLELELELAREQDALRISARGRLAGGYPLARRTLRYELLAYPAAPQWSPGGSRPLPPFAPRRSGPARQLARGELPLDATGSSSLTLPLPDESQPTLLLARTWLSEGGLRARAHGTCLLGPPLTLRLEPGERVSRPDRLIQLRARAIDREGRAQTRPELVLRARPGPEAEPWVERALRVEARGTQTSLSLSERGPAVLELAEPGGVRTQERVFLSDPQAARPADRLALLLDREPSAVHLLGLLPRTKGTALLTLRSPGELQARTYASLDAQLPFRLPTPPRPGASVGLRVWQDGAWQRAEAEVPVGPPPLEVRVTCEPAAVGGEVLASCEVRQQGERVGVRLLSALYDERSARWLDRRPQPTSLRESASAPVSSLALTCAAASVSEAPASQAQLSLPAPPRPGRWWLRVEARGPEGARGVGWALCEVSEPLGLSAVAPPHLVEEDQSELVVDLRCAAPAPLVLRWKAAQLAFDPPRVSGAQLRLGGDPGASALALQPTRRARVVLPFRANKPGVSPVELELIQEGEPPLKRTLRVPCRVRPGGLVEVRWQQGEAAPRGRTRVTLAAPPRGLPDTSELELAITPTPLTALLAGLEDLERQPGLLPRLEALSVRRLLPILWARRRLARPQPEGAPAWDEVRRELIASRGRWGSEALRIGVALLRLRGLGFEVEEELLTGLPEAARRSQRPERLTLLALLGEELPALPPSTPAERVRWGLARGGPASLALARAAAADAGPAAQAELLSALLQAQDDQTPGDQTPGDPTPGDPPQNDPAPGDPPQNDPPQNDPPPGDPPPGDPPRDAQDEPAKALAAARALLLKQLLAARRGAGWSDPGSAGACLRALLRLSLREDGAGLRIEARHEGRRWLRTYVGAGLEEWAGVLRRRDGRLTQGSRLQLRLRDAKQPASFSLALRSIVRRDPQAPATREGLALTRQLPARLRVGERCVLSLALAGEGPLPSGLALELPLPGGVEVLTPPPGARLQAGILELPLRQRALELELLARHPGRYRILPARAWLRSDPAKRATTREARLEVTAE